MEKPLRRASSFGRTEARKFRRRALVGLGFALVLILIIPGSTVTKVYATSASIACTSSPVLVYGFTKCTVTVGGTSPDGNITWSSTGPGGFYPPSCDSGTELHQPTSLQCTVYYVPTSLASPVTITASYVGDSNNPPASGMLSLTVTTSPTSALVNCFPSSAPVGFAATCTVFISYNIFSIINFPQAAPPPPTGTVQWSSSGGSGAFNSTSCAVPNGRLLNPESCVVTYTPSSSASPVTIKATYQGNGFYTANSSSYQLNVTPARTIVSSISGTSTSSTSSPTTSPSSGGGLPWWWPLVVIALVGLLGGGIYVIRGKPGGGTSVRKPEGPGCQIGHDWQHYEMNVSVSVAGQHPSTGATTYTTLGSTSGRFAGHGVPVPLRADSLDTHVLIHTCACPGVDGDQSVKLHKLLANVRYEWEIVEGEGAFQSGSDLVKATTGQQAIYWSPVVKLPVQKEEEPPPKMVRDGGGVLHEVRYARPTVLLGNPEESSDEKELKKEVRIRVSAHHDDPTKPPNHGPVHVDLVLEMRREKIVQVSVTGDQQGAAVDRYVFDWWAAGEGYLRANTVLPKERNGVCEPQHEWLVGSPIAGGFIFPSADIDINKNLWISPGDLVLMKAEGVDTDVLMLKCIPTGGPCKVPAESPLTMNDLLYYEWTADTGEFVNGGPDRETVWRAPPFEGEVKISLKIRNGGGHAGGVETQFVDEPPKFVETTFEVRKPLIGPQSPADETTSPTSTDTSEKPKDCSEAQLRYDEAMARYKEKIELYEKSGRDQKYRPRESWIEVTKAARELAYCLGGDFAEVEAKIKDLKPPEVW